MSCASLLYCFSRRIWSDIKRAFSKPYTNLNLPVRIIFSGEEAVDDGGPRRDWQWVLLQVTLPYFSTSIIVGEEHFGSCEQRVSLCMEVDRHVNYARWSRPRLFQSVGV